MDLLVYAFITLLSCCVFDVSVFVNVVEVVVKVDWLLVVFTHYAEES